MSFPTETRNHIHASGGKQSQSDKSSKHKQRVIRLKKMHKMQLHITCFLISINLRIWRSQTKTVFGKTFKLFSSCLQNSLYPLSPKGIHIPPFIIRILGVPRESGAYWKTLRSKQGKQQGRENKSIQK